MWSLVLLFFEDFIVRERTYYFTPRHKVVAMILRTEEGWFGLPVGLVMSCIVTVTTAFWTLPYGV